MSDDEILTDEALARFAHGQLARAWCHLGAHLTRKNGIGGAHFATWAPHAQRVSVVGDFNAWSVDAAPLRRRSLTGVWEAFLPGVPAGAHYKFNIVEALGEQRLRADPYARWSEVRPSDASRVAPESTYPWHDEAWLQRRAEADWEAEPIAIYEVHLGSWRRAPDGGFLSYAVLARELARYANEFGFTHVEILPIAEHPLDESWGYQCTGYYAPTSRYGTPDEFREFVDTLHAANLGVILDWVPAHFPKDQWALARFDGTPLYEYADPRLGDHPDWGTAIFDYARPQVRNFLISNALYWLEEFHIDGLRIDAVSSMLYLDYSRDPGEWLPNQFGGKEHLDGAAFVRECTGLIAQEQPSAMLIAEESSAWPGVTGATQSGGLGFAMKWNIGWMNDTLTYFQTPPQQRAHVHDRLTFPRMYAFKERFLLSLSHDEVVQLKGSLLERMPGNQAERFANLRLLYAYQFTYPGKKLSFMGSEFGESTGWESAHELAWDQVKLPEHAGLRRAFMDMLALYRTRTALHASDFDERGFTWLVWEDASNPVIAYLRSTDESALIIVLNFGAKALHDYSVPVPTPGVYRECFNSDSLWYGGANVGNGGRASAESIGVGAYALHLTLPALGALVFELEQLL